MGELANMYDAMETQMLTEVDMTRRMVEVVSEIPFRLLTFISLAQLSTTLISLSYQQDNPTAKTLENQDN